MIPWLASFEYELPEAQIAKEPATPRDASRLLVLDRESGARTQTTFRQLPHFLRPGDLLVLNETRVVPARLLTRLERTGRDVEVLLSHPEEDSWIAMLGPSRRLKPGDRLVPDDGGARTRPDVDPGARQDSGRLGLDPEPGRLVLVEALPGGLWRIRGEETSVETLMARTGHIPLPPYLHREDRPEDRTWYQTVFARVEGAVAAPTAGLHFTESLLTEIERMGVELARVVLHVGPGTFLPVRAEDASEHRVLPERYAVPVETAEAARRARARGGRLIAVGTTTVRALETAAMNAAAETEGRAGEKPSEADERATGEPAATEGAPVLQAGTGWTGLTILPGHRFLAVDALITNFHLPCSSLLLLVAAFAGREQVLEAYAEARDARFRFFSYGDAMLIQ